MYDNNSLWQGSPSVWLFGAGGLCTLGKGPSGLGTPAPQRRAEPVICSSPACLLDRQRACRRGGHANPHSCAVPVCRH
jgi:hypothetical protein